MLYTYPLHRRISNFLDVLSHDVSKLTTLDYQLLSASPRFSRPKSAKAQEGEDTNRSSSKGETFDLGQQWPACG